MAEGEETLTIQAHNFAPSELALVAPDVAMQKYLEAGYRPSLRKFFEFKPVSIARGGLSRYDGEGAPNRNSHVLGSSIVKSHGTTVVTYVSASLIEDSFEAVNDYRTRLESDLITAGSEDSAAQALQRRNGSVYPVVEISRGMSGPPTTAEIELGEQLYTAVLTSGVIPRESLKVSIGLKTTDEKGNVEIVHRGADHVTDEVLGNLTDKTFSYVLQARVQVFGSTGSVYDLCHGGLLRALRDTRLPKVYLSEREAVLRSRRGKSVVSDQAIEGYDLVCDSRETNPLLLDESKLSWNSTFGILDVATGSFKPENDGTNEDVDMDAPEKSSALLADLEGDIESTIAKRVSVSVNAQGKIVGLRIQKAGGASSNPVTRSAVDHAVTLATQRAQSLIPQL